MTDATTVHVRALRELVSELEWLTLTVAEHRTLWRELDALRDAYRRVLTRRDGARGPGVTGDELRAVVAELERGTLDVDELRALRVPVRDLRYAYRRILSIRAQLTLELR